jgi:uncharacterized protein (DUF488 family)
MDLGSHGKRDNVNRIERTVASLATVGHGTRTTKELASLLREAGVDVVVDVRRFPGSRRHPHLARNRLEEDLRSFGLEYWWWGEHLGGRRSASGSSRHPALRNAAFRAFADHMDGRGFRTELERLEVAAAERRLALMCAETLWWRCHRRLIADVLVARGHSVEHLIGPGKQQPHPLNPSARYTDDGWLVYDRAAP